MQSLQSRLIEDLAILASSDIATVARAVGSNSYGAPIEGTCFRFEPKGSGYRLYWIHRGKIDLMDIEVMAVPEELVPSPLGLNHPRYSQALRAAISIRHTNAAQQAIEYARKTLAVMGAIADSRQS